MLIGDVGGCWDRLHCRVGLGRAHDLAHKARRRGPISLSVCGNPTPLCGTPPMSPSASDNGHSSNDGLATKRAD